MSRMPLIERPFEKGSPLNKVYLYGISFSLYSTPQVPIALVYSDSAFLDTRSFHLSPANALEFIYRTCTANLRPFRGSTRWSDINIYNIGISGFNVSVLKIGEDSADQMSFSMKTFYPDEDETSGFFLKTEIEYQSPAFYLFQLAEFPLATDGGLTIHDGVTSMLIAGSAALFSSVAKRYGILHGPELTVEDAIVLSNGIKSKKMPDDPKPEDAVYESAERGCGYNCNGATIDDAPNVSVKFSSNGTNILALNGEELPLKGPSITVLQNMDISARGIHDSIIPIARDLVFAAAQTCPTLPMSYVV